MSKTIKLEDEVNEQLNRFRLKDETRSDAVARLLRINEAIKRVEDILEGGAKFREGQRERRTAEPTFQEREACKSQNDLK